MSSELPTHICPSDPVRPCLTVSPLRHSLQHLDTQVKMRSAATTLVTLGAAATSVAAAPNYVMYFDQYVHRVPPSYGLSV